MPQSKDELLAFFAEVTNSLTSYFEILFVAVKSFVAQIWESSISNMEENYYVIAAKFLTFGKFEKSMSPLRSSNYETKVSKFSKILDHTNVSRDEETIFSL